MARARMISRALSDSKRFAKLASERHRMMYTLMLPWLDKAGRLEADPTWLRGKVFTMLELSTADIEAGLRDLDRVGLIWLYRVGAERYLEYRGFLTYNTPHKKEPESALPAPEDDDRSCARLPDVPGASRKGSPELEGEGKGEVEGELELEQEGEGEAARARPAKPGSIRAQASHRRPPRGKASEKTHRSRRDASAQASSLTASRPSGSAPPSSDSSFAPSGRSTGGGGAGASKASKSPKSPKPPTSAGSFGAESSGQAGAEAFFVRHAGRDFAVRYAQELPRWFERHGPKRIRAFIEQARPEHWRGTPRASKRMSWNLADLLDGELAPPGAAEARAPSGAEILARVLGEADAGFEFAAPLAREELSAHVN